MRVHRAPHQVLRYAPVLRVLRELPADARVLEVGSGSEGIGTWWDRPFIGVDLAFSHRPMRHMRAVVADGLRLPFPDGSFDAVVCVAVLTHVVGCREALLDECLRVCRGSVVAVTPCGEEAALSDLRNAQWSARAGHPVPSWLDDQIRSGPPTSANIREMLGVHGDLVEIPTISVAAHERLFRAEQRMRRVRGAMTLTQPLLRAWGRVGPASRANDGPPYEVCFVLRRQRIVSPPRRSS
ncbi:MAG: class I SAM-dependent methyltransferase [Actinomycetota bacterium]